MILTNNYENILKFVKVMQRILYSFFRHDVIIISYYHSFRDASPCLWNTLPHLLTKTDKTVIMLHKINSYHALFKKEIQPQMRK